MVAATLLGRGHRAEAPAPGPDAGPPGPGPEGRIRAGSTGGTAAGRQRRPCYLLGWGVTRRYGLRALNPFGNRSLASSSETAGTMMTSSPSFQLTGVATL